VYLTNPVGAEILRNELSFLDNAQTFLNTLQPKSRSGADIKLDSDISSPLSQIAAPSTAFDEHAMGLENATRTLTPGYVGDIEKLVKYANDPASIYFYVSGVGRAIRTDTVYSGPVPQIAIGNGSGKGGVMHVKPGDQYALGDINRADTIIWEGNSDANVKVDGGGGKDVLFVSGDKWNLLPGAGGITYLYWGR